MTIEACLKKHALENPDKLAVATLDGSLSFSELWNCVEKTAYILKQDYRVKSGDYVLIRSSQTTEHIISYFAIHTLGCVAVPLEKDVPNAVLREMIEKTKSNLLLSLQKEETDTNLQMLDLNTLRERIDSYGDVVEWHDFPEETVLADVMLTTGTTGKSKGVMLSQKNLLATSENLIHGFEMKDTDCMLVVGPLNHANAIRKIYTAAILGSSVVVINGMSSIKNFFVALERFPINCLCLPPSAVQVLLAMSGDKLHEYRNRILYVENSTAPMSGYLRQKLKELLPMSRLYNGYGASEAGSIVIYDYAAVEKPENCAGKPSYKASLCFVDEKGNTIRSSKENSGQLVCKSDVNMQGYLGDPDLTAEILKDGQVYMSDIGYFDEEGYVYLIGRKDNVINIGGLKVAPEEVENVIESYDGVKECLLFQGRSANELPVLCCLVVASKDRELNEASLKQFMKENLEHYKIPQEIRIVEEIPHTYNGKKYRKEVRNYFK